jgi:hypothetical protein
VKEAPAAARTPAGAYIETLGETMRNERTRLDRVRAVAEGLKIVNADQVDAVVGEVS